MVKGGHLQGHESTDLLVETARDKTLTGRARRRPAHAWHRLHVRGGDRRATGARGYAGSRRHGAKEYVTGAMRHGIDVGARASAAWTLLADTMTHHASETTVSSLTAARWRVAIMLTIAMMVMYFGFILLVAFNKPLLGREIVHGLSLGILLGALVIVSSWLLIWIYARWANTHYDADVARLRRSTWRRKPEGVVNAGRGTRSVSPTRPPSPDS